MARGKKTAGKKASLTKERKRAFKEWNEQREDKTEEFRQCKSVPYWYISDEGRIISFGKPDEPKFLRVATTKKGYKHVSGNKNTYYVHRLMAESFPEVYVYGKAKTYKDLNGVEVHHINGVRVNKPSCLEVLDPDTHYLLFKNVPAISDDYEKHLEYEQRLMKVVEENTPEQNVIVLTGKGIDLTTGKEIDNCPQAVYADDVDSIDRLISQALDMVNTGLKEGKFKVEINPELIK